MDPSVVEQMALPREFDLEGFVPSGVTPTFAKREHFNLSILQGWKGVTLRNIIDFAKFVLFKREQHTMQVGDARKLQEESGLSPAEFFNEHGFVLLAHETAMKEKDWHNADAVKKIYAPEVEQLIRDRLDIAENFTVHEGDAVVRGPKFESYGLGIHQDFGLSPDSYLRNVDAYSGEKDPQSLDVLRKKHFGPKPPLAMMSLNFWRPIEPMTGPIMQHPLMICDRTSVSFDDAVPTELEGFAPNGRTAPSQHLRHSSKQKFYVYPFMKKGEVLVHVQFAWVEGMTFSDEPGQSRTSKLFPSCFHGALVDPKAPKDAESRYSAEYRCRIDFPSSQLRYKMELAGAEQ